MVQKIIWSVEAENNLIEIKDYIARDSLFYAEKTIKGIVDKIQTLYDHPEQGMVVLTTRGLNYRRLLYKSYRIIYLYGEASVFVIAIFHQARQQPDHFDNHLFT